MVIHGMIGAKDSPWANACYQHNGTSAWGCLLPSAD